MSRLEEIKTKLKLDLQEVCFDNGVDFQSMEKMIETEKIKKLRKGNHYIQQVIDKEIEKISTNEN